MRTKNFFTLNSIKVYLVRVLTHVPQSILQIAGCRLLISCVSSLRWARLCGNVSVFVSVNWCDYKQNYFSFKLPIETDRCEAHFSCRKQTEKHHISSVIKRKLFIDLQKLSHIVSSYTLVKLCCESFQFFLPIVFFIQYN